MDVRVRYGKRLDSRLKSVLACMAEKACIEDKRHIEELSELVCDVLELVWLCQEHKKKGMEKRYETRAYISESGISFQSETIEAAPSQPLPVPSHSFLLRCRDIAIKVIFLHSL